MDRRWTTVMISSTVGAAVLVVVMVVVPAPSMHDARRDGGSWMASTGGHVHETAAVGMHPGGEYAFLAGMVAHHEEAIEAARELRRSGSVRMRRLGEDIVRSQRAQVHLMAGWLADWYPDRPRRAPGYRPMMRDLSGLRGAALDRAFLEDMVPHHMMAVMSAQRLLHGDTEHTEVMDLAADIRDEQRDEIALMRGWLVRAPG